MFKNRRKEQFETIVNFANEMEALGQASREAAAEGCELADSNVGQKSWWDQEVEMLKAQRDIEDAFADDFHALTTEAKSIAEQGIAPEAARTIGSNVVHLATYRSQRDLTA